MSGAAGIAFLQGGEDVKPLGYRSCRTMDDMLSDWRRRIREDLKGWQGLYAALPAVVTYALAAVGLRLTGTTLGEVAGDPPTAFEALGTVTMFTACYGFGVAGLFGLAWRLARGLGFGFWFWGWFALGVLYGLPVYVLASETGWLSLLGAAVHIVMAPRGTRMWTAIEYGSSSFCLMLFLLVYESGLFPLGLLALVFQVVVLLLMHLTVRHLWEGAPDASSPNATGR